MPTPPVEARTSAWMGAVDNSSQASFGNNSPRINSPKANIQNQKNEDKSTNQGFADDSGDQSTAQSGEEGSSTADHLSTASTAVEESPVELQQLVQNVKDLLAQGLLFLNGAERQKKEYAKLRDEMKKHNEVAAEWTSGMQDLSSNFDRHVRQCKKHFDMDTDGGSASGSSESESETISSERGNRQSARDTRRAADAEKRRRGNRAAPGGKGNSKGNKWDTRLKIRDVV
ncbi:uncharacterized protein LY89DRAFT_670720 [Mollisia scopiformis]|uniref:Uncharacterized protein n=1 Tax=Mollisia scopiformis TaxID=149040 RepID=A0A194X4W8_MOLSC|nr:uncharacterized protein LY89DRAFT_670720 [Mollisia scopiformis]KUJ15220.1 hypothetical protein LY89DRAFT_670720 [Mollisia scopiformis]